MNSENYQPKRSRYILTGLLAGLFAVIANLVFEVIFRLITKFNYSMVVNVSTIIFGTVIMVMIGSICYSFLHNAKGGLAIYAVIFLAITCLLTFLVINGSVPKNIHEVSHHKELMAGIIVITGLFTAFGVPLLIRKPEYISGIL